MPATPDRRLTAPPDCHAARDHRRRRRRSSSRYNRYKGYDRYKGYNRYRRRRRRSSSRYNRYKGYDRYKGVQPLPQEKAAELEREKAKVAKTAERKRRASLETNAAVLQVRNGM